MSDRFTRVLTIISVFVGLFGVTLAIFFYSKSIQERVPTFYIHPSRVRIVDADGPSSSELKVLYRDEPVGKRSVIAIRLYLWNDGRIPIRKSDVLQTLAFRLQPPAEILESQVLKKSREVTNFTIGQVEGSNRNILPISFDILEKSDGAAIQVIYAGDPNAAISLEGCVIGVRAPKRLGVSSAESYYKRRSPTETLKERKRMALVFGSFGCIIFLSSFLLWIFARRKKDERKLRRARRALVAGGIIFIIYFGFSGYLYYDTYRTFSPGVPALILMEE